MNKPLRIGIAGLGTVGGGALAILQAQGAMLAGRCGRPLEVAGVSARDKNKNRNLIAKLRWFDDALAMASDSDIDVIVETIGGAEGVAKALVEAALANGKSVVTANKALIAQHGLQLASLAEEHHVVLAFEAAVAGGIPIIKALRDGLAANNFKCIAGILNGTCNYILTSMWDEKRSFDEVLKEAQAKGYAEADPGFDIDGIDTAHKLAILTSLAYGVAPDVTSMTIEGIRRITLADMNFADELGYVIKLLGITATMESGICQRVHPCFVAKGSPLAGVHGVYNAVLVEGDAVGRMLFEGRGAGAGPTASSVVADIMDIARGVTYKPFTLPVAQLKASIFAPTAALSCSYYLRLSVVDRPGVLAEITGIFREQNISMRSVIQHAHAGSEAVHVVITTHVTGETAMLAALVAIEKLGSVKEKPLMIRIEEL